LNFSIFPPNVSSSPTRNSNFTLIIFGKCFPKFTFFRNIFSKIYLNVVFRFFFHSYSSILDSIFQNVNFFGKHFPNIQIFWKEKSKIALENIFQSDFGKRFPKFCYIWSEPQFCSSNLIFHQSQSFFTLFLTLISIQT
jgi:hypothetical protein